MAEASLTGTTIGPISAIYRDILLIQLSIVVSHLAEKQGISVGTLRSDIAVATKEMLGGST